MDKKKKRGRPRKGAEARAEHVTIGIPKSQKEFLDVAAKESGQTYTDLIVMAIELMKSNGVIIERRIIRGDCAADPPTSGE